MTQRSIEVISRSLHRMLYPIAPFNTTYIHPPLPLPFSTSSPSYSTPHLVTHISHMRSSSSPSYYRLPTPSMPVWHTTLHLPIHLSQSKARGQHSRTIRIRPTVRRYAHPAEMLLDRVVCVEQFAQCDCGFHSINVNSGVAAVCAGWEHGVACFAAHGGYEHIRP